MKAQTARKLRTFHHYIGVFFAPAILFFAFSGTLQTFGLHEARGWGGASPPGWIAWMGNVHKDQDPDHGAHGPAKHADADHDHADHADADHDHADAAPKPAAKPEAATPPATYVLKLFVGLMGAGLVLSSLLGITIALTLPSMRRVSIVMLAAGTLLPLALLLV